LNNPRHPGALGGQFPLYCHRRPDSPPAPAARVRLEPHPRAGAAGGDWHDPAGAPLPLTTSSRGCWAAARSIRRITSGRQNTQHRPYRVPLLMRQMASTPGNGRLHSLLASRDFGQSPIPLRARLWDRPAAHAIISNPLGVGVGYSRLDRHLLRVFYDTNNFHSYNTTHCGGTRP
jgi:hypothetical protein